MFKYTKYNKYRYLRGKLMDIKVSGGKSAKTRRLIKQAAEFYGHLLMSRRMVSSICLDIKIKTKLDEDADGYCHFDDHVDGYRFFEIELQNKKDAEELLTVLAHEMTHLKQWACGEMKQGKIMAHKTIWHGQAFYDSEVDYWDTPWEIEAFGREKGLVMKYVCTFGYPK